MAEIWEITVDTGDFVGGVVIDDTTGEANWAILPTTSTEAPYSGQAPGFIFTRAFNFGPSTHQYAFSAGTGGPSTYTGQVTYPTPTKITTNWTAQKKAGVASKRHDAA